MTDEAAEKGFYHSPGWSKGYPRLPILAVEDILNGKTIKMPPNTDADKQAHKVVKESNDQGMSLFE